MTRHYHKEVQIDGAYVGKTYPIELSVETVDMQGRPDCKIGHFGYNFWLRTPYGIKYKVYKSNKAMERAIEKVLTNNGIKVLGWVEDK